MLKNKAWLVIRQVHCSQLQPTVNILLGFLPVILLAPISKRLLLCYQGDCKVDISQEILQQSVIMSADVIEHIIDPYYCYLPLMSYIMDHALGLVISTPDRELRGKSKAHPIIQRGNSGVSLTPCSPHVELAYPATVT